MRNRRSRATAATLDEDESGPGFSLPFRIRKDMVAWIGAGLCSGAIMINALFMQSGPHPAPFFANKPPPAATPSRSISTLTPAEAMGATGAVLLPRPRPPESEPAREGPPRPRAEIITELQKELTRRGFYEGAADGIYGAKTDAAIRDFEQAAGLRAGSELNENFLRTVMRSSVKGKPTAEPKVDPIAAIIAPPRRVIAAQRALAEFGYGQIKPTGVLGPETQQAIERFERERKLPVTGQLSDNVVRELAAMTGRPLE